ncbi:MAG: Calx-beta domain-containing protein [Thermoanaerobaculia bacterium]
MLLATAAPALAGPGRISLQTRNDAHVGEGETMVSLTVLRTDGADGTVSVGVRTASGDATPGADYETLTETLVWGNGDSSPRTVQITILDDLEVELPTEAFLVNLWGLTGGATFGAWITQAVDIEDNEIAPHGRFTLQGPSEFILVEAEVAVTFTVARTEGNEGPVSVRLWTCCGDATAGSDYDAVNQVLTWADGDSSPRNVAIALHDDLLVESPTERFDVLLASASGGAWYGSVLGGSVTLRDNDIPVHGRISFASAPWQQVVEQEGEIVLTVARTEGTAGEVSVRVTTCCGDATPDADYAALDEVLTWADGEADEKSVIVTIFDDELVESPTEVFLVQLSEAGGGAMLGLAPVTTIVIADEEGQVLFGDDFESADECNWSTNQGGSSCAH